MKSRIDQELDLAWDTHERLADTYDRLFRAEEAAAKAEDWELAAFANQQAVLNMDASIRVMRGIRVLLALREDRPVFSVREILGY